MAMNHSLKSTTADPTTASDLHHADLSYVVNRVITAESHRLEVSETEVPPGLSRPRQFSIIFLVLLCNLIQYASQFSTVAGGYEFSARLGVEVGPGKANWMAAAYGLTQGSFVLISGRLGAVYGHQRLLILGGAILVVFSLANAFCNTYVSFIAMRALTGVGGGILMPNAVATLTIMVPPGKARNFTLATFAASPPIGAMIGALIAGAVLKYTEWKWHFIILSCLGAVSFGSLFFTFPPEDPVDKDGKIDVIGAFLGLSGLLLFSVAWNQAPSVGWQTPAVIVIMILSVLLIAFFFVWEIRFAIEPIMPLTAFKAPSFNALVFVVLFIYMSVGILLWYMVAWEQLIRDWTVLHIAVGWIPYGIGASVAVIVAAWLITLLEAQYILALGCLTSFAASVLLATMPEQQLYWMQVFPATILGSLCPDFVYVAAQIIASNCVEKHEQGVAGSLIGTLNLYGNSLGLGFAGTIESQVSKRTNNEVAGFRAALWFGAALAVAALALDLGFVRLRHVDREDWDSPRPLDPEATEVR
ncbi:MFS general substrate transporter [Penicillium sp. CMV-2018d]|nr:MFS general substrate transporter [Penicillium sp. CMV-2018d]